MTFMPLSGLDAVKDQISNAVYPSEYLLEELETDVGACYRPEHIKGLKMLRKRNKPEYMKLRAKLKKLKIGITELENDFANVGADDGRTTEPPYPGERNHRKIRPGQFCLCAGIYLAMGRGSEVFGE